MSKFVLCSFTIAVALAFSPIRSRTQEKVSVLIVLLKSWDVHAAAL